MTDTSGREKVLEEVDQLFDQKVTDYIPDVSAIDVRMSFQTRLKYRTLAEIRQAIRALSQPPKAIR